MNDPLTETTRFRRHSHADILHSPSHRRSNSARSVDIFNLVVPTNSDSTLSQLICPMCSLPMKRPTILPCKHTFCFQCIENKHHVHASSAPTHLNNYLSPIPNPTIVVQCPQCSRLHRLKSLEDLEEDHSLQLLINTLLCEQCHQLHPSKQIDTCSDCYRVFCINCYKQHVQSHRDSSKTNKYDYRDVSTDETVNISMTLDSDENDQSSDSQIFKPRSFNNEKKLTTELTKPTLVKENNVDENTDPSEITNTKKKSTIFHRIMSPSRRHRSPNVSNKDSVTKNSSPSVIKQTNSTKSILRKKLTINTNIQETSKTESIQTNLPVTPLRQFVNLTDQYSNTVQRVQKCKQRKTELDRTVQKLIEVLTIKTNENINQISQYWSYLKQTLLDQFQSKTNRFLIFDYLLKNCCSGLDSRKQIGLYVEKNDEIKAALEVLSKTLNIVTNQQSLSIISQLFDREGRTTIRTLKNQLETLLSSYSDSCSFINEFVIAYEARFATWKEPNPIDLNLITDGWTKIIKEDYPSLIEKISNDFINTIPQLEQTLLQMLNNMRKRLLTIDNQTTSQRTSTS
ncbi:unnamed protein product [Rotaria sp. Silwood1]|nr:unnamed protein product [Rotaria sp. Silwood1]CAF3461225.1 unnamed protein product [Rotaria sp. Silwood1]CAF3523657.1 unnamed protein product [Rotaria sp. Silwood1]CAF4575806.1 unnamed protein product [Rotaria sp. Silwood1]